MLKGISKILTMVLVLLKGLGHLFCGHNAAQVPAASCGQIYTSSERISSLLFSFLPNSGTTLALALEWNLNFWYFTMLKYFPFDF